MGELIDRAPALLMAAITVGGLIANVAINLAAIKRMETAIDGLTDDVVELKEWKARQEGREDARRHGRDD
jgi:hypothetical protein